MCIYIAPCLVVCTILLPHPGIEPTPLAVKVQSPNHWITRKFPASCIFDVFITRLGKNPNIELLWLYV